MDKQKRKKGGAEKLQAKKINNLDAAKCAKVTDMFAARAAAVASTATVTAVPAIMQQQVEGGEVAGYGQC